MTQFLPLKVYLDSGTEGGEKAEDVWELSYVLEQRGLTPKVVIDEGARHSEIFWAKRFPEALKFLFKNKT